MEDSSYRQKGQQRVDSLNKLAMKQMIKQIPSIISNKEHYISQGTSKPNSKVVTSKRQQSTQLHSQSKGDEKPLNQGPQTSSIQSNEFDFKSQSLINHDTSLNLPSDSSKDHLTLRSQFLLPQYVQQHHRLESIQNNITYDFDDQRHYPPSHPQYYFVSKRDLESNQSYKLNIIKPQNNRSKMKAFFSTHYSPRNQKSQMLGRHNDENPALTKFKAKFLNANPKSSQISTSLSTKRVIDIQSHKLSALNSGGASPSLFSQHAATDFANPDPLNEGGGSNDYPIGSLYKKPTTNSVMFQTANGGVSCDNSSSQLNFWKIKNEIKIPKYMQVT